MLKEEAGHVLEGRLEVLEYLTETEIEVRKGKTTVTRPDHMFQPNQLLLLVMLKPAL